MAKKDYENKSLDELTELKRDIKSEINALQAKAAEIGEVQNALIESEHVERARVSMQDWADHNGKSLDEAIDYWEGRLDPNGTTGRWTQSLLLQGKRGAVRI